MTSWPAKDPQSVLDYRYNAPLDAGDALSTIAITRLSGTVTIDSSQGNASGISAWLSGGVNGETSVFRVAWTTTAGRSDEAIITLAVVANEPAIGAYAVPTPGQLKLRYPAFAEVADEVAAYWIADARRIVTGTWIEADYPIAIMLHAAHELAQAGLEGGDAAGMPQGVTRFRSGSMDVAFSDSMASATGYQATRYGREFLTYLKRNRGGAIVVQPGTVPPEAVYPRWPL